MPGQVYVAVPAAEYARLLRFAADVAGFGLRCNLNPTMNLGAATGDMYQQWREYLARVEGNIVDRARGALDMLDEASGDARRFGHEFVVAFDATQHHFEYGSKLPARYELSDGELDEAERLGRFWATTVYGASCERGEGCWNESISDGSFFDLYRKRDLPAGCDCCLTTRCRFIDLRARYPRWCASNPAETCVGESCEACGHDQSVPKPCWVAGLVWTDGSTDMRKLTREQVDIILQTLKDGVFPGGAAHTTASCTECGAELFDFDLSEHVGMCEHGICPDCAGRARSRKRVG